MKHPSILVIDDEESMTTMIAGYLGAKGYPVTVANEGEDALARIANGEFPIVISDIYIDRVNGLDIDNLYAETTLIGQDYPERSADPEFKLTHMIQLADGCSPAKWKALTAKLFIGTDFPWFYKKDDSKGGYRFQRECLAPILKEDFDETGMTKRFLVLPPIRTCASPGGFDYAIQSSCWSSYSQRTANSVLTVRVRPEDRLYSRFLHLMLRTPAGSASISITKSNTTPV